MTTTLSIGNAYCSPHDPDRITKLAQTAWASIKRWNQRRRDVEHLRSLSDQQLDDIGIRRSEIHNAVYGEGRGPTQTPVSAWKTWPSPYCCH